VVDALTGGETRAETRALLLLDLLPGVGPARVGTLVSAFGSGRAALVAPAPAFRALAGGDALAARSDPRYRDRVDRGLERAEALGMILLPWGDPGYPSFLRRLSDPPPVLFLRGNAELLQGRGVAVVGARRATARGREVARRLGSSLGASGVTVVSGLALGVDGAAHAGALEGGGPTVAVLGSGAERSYPRSHRVLFQRVLERGLVVSEFLPGTPAHRYHFPRRNRVIAALARAVVVVEAREKSGALITVDHALDLGLDVYAVPGPIDSPTCVGSNALLGDGARPLLSVGELPPELAPSPAASAGSGEEDPREGPSAVRAGPVDDPDAAAVLRCLAEGAASIDAVARATGMGTPRALAVLTRLELQGRARRLAGSRYRRAG
jgi:DNA processing protein